MCPAEDGIKKVQVLRAPLTYGFGVIGNMMVSETIEAGSKRNEVEFMNTKNKISVE